MSYYYAYTTDNGTPENIGVYYNNYDGSYYYSKVTGFYKEISVGDGIYETFVQADFYNSTYRAYELYDGSYPNYGSLYVTYSAYYGEFTKLNKDITSSQYHVGYTSGNSYYGSAYHKLSYYYGTAPYSDGSPGYSHYETVSNYYSPATGYYKGPYSDTPAYAYSSGLRI